ncbi:unnamed protein product [Phytophthora fragariaefolia]|uniref:RxLR effector protein n=1 Tax=Phytophthora fragariaefolia TaxID=1490495 RepID=A0A9W7CYK6_9STRA|nr:unnamed protein product [Phytophthora fragariaefolia]
MISYFSLLLVLAVVFLLASNARACAGVSSQKTVTSIDSHPSTAVFANRIIKNNKVSDTAEVGDDDDEARGVKDAANYVASLFSKNKRIQRMFAKDKSFDYLFDKSVHPVDVWFALKIRQLQSKLTHNDLLKNPKFIFWSQYEAFWATKTTLA